MKVFFRTDASIAIGTGHVMRCMTLADTLRQCGCECVFVCREHAGNLGDLIRLRGYAVHMLPVDAASVPQTWPKEQLSPHMAWLGAAWELDAAQTAALAQQAGVDLLVVDHYALDSHWEMVLRPFCKRILVIDDLADRSHDCDFLLDQNLYASPEQRYAGLLCGQTKIMLGPAYSLLRSEFLESRQRIRERDGSVKQLLLFMGGSDEANVTSRVLEALSISQHSNLAVDVVVGSSNPNIDDVQGLCEKLPNALLHRQIDNMAELMLKADLALGATGVATWERAAMGLPALAVSVADNQRAIGRHADEVGLLTWLGDADTVSILDWAQGIDKACASEDRLRRQGKAGLNLVDALGTQRVAEVLL